MVHVSQLTHDACMRSAQHARPAAAQATGAPAYQRPGARAACTVQVELGATKKGVPLGAAPAGSPAGGLRRAGPEDGGGSAGSARASPVGFAPAGHQRRGRA